MDRDTVNRIVDTVKDKLDNTGIVVITGEGCQVCEEIFDKLKDRKDVDILHLTKDAIMTLLQEGVEVTLPVAVKDGKLCKFELSKDGSMAVNCDGEKTEL